MIEFAYIVIHWNDDVYAVLLILGNGFLEPYK